MNDNVQVSITATDEGASSVIQGFEQRLVALETAYKNSAGAADITSAAVKGSGEAATVATAKWEGLGAALEQMSGHARTVGIALNAAGLETGAAVAKVDGLAAAFKGLQASLGPLLVLLVGIEAAVKGFEFLKSGIELSTKLQASMETLGAAVENQGGNWDKLKDSVDKWAASEAMASGITKDQLIPALSELVTAGISLSDSQKMLAVAEEVAIAKHKSVLEVTHALIEAEAGRGMELVRLDTHLKNVIHSHEHMSQVLQVLHNDTKNQISADESLERASARLKVEQESVAEVLGTKLIPFMTQLQYEFIGGLQNGEQFGRGIVDSFNSIIDAAKAVGLALGGVFSAMAKASHADFAGAAADFMGGISGAHAQFSAAQALGVKGTAEMFNMDEAGVVGRRMAHGDVAAHMAGLGDLSLSNDPIMGYGHAGHSGSGRHGGSGHHGSGRGHSEGADFNFKALEDQLKPAKKSVDEFQLALDKLPKTVDGYKTAIAQLTDVIAKETVEHNALVKQQKDAHDMYEALLKVYNEFGASLGKHPTKAEKQELSDLAAQVRGAKADYDHLTTAVDNNTTALQKHQQQLIHDSAEEQRLIEEVSKKHEEAYQKMENEAKKYADEVIKFFEKMGKSGKGVFADLLDAFKEMIDNMIKKFVESKLMDLFMKFMGGSAGGGSLAAGAGMLLPGISMPGFSGAAPAMVSTASGQAVAVHVSGIESSLLGATAPGGALVGVGGGATMLGGLAGIGGGALLGGIGAGLTHGNQTNGAIGGALGVAGLALVQGGLVGGGMMGGLGSLIAAGPAGWAILAAAGLLGGIAGGMLGHKDNPALMPDKYDTAAFGQFMANLGTHNDHATSTTDQIANGSHFNIDPAIAAATQGKGEGQYIHDLIAGMSDEQGKAKFGADWDHIKAIFSGWTPGGIQLHDGSWNGFNWQDINATAQKAMNTLGGSGAADSPVFKITRTYPDFNASSIASATGGGGTGGTGTGTGGGTGSPGEKHLPPGLRGRGDTNDGPVVNVTIQGSVVGPGGISDVAQAISKELAKINRGQSFGGYSTSKTFGS